MYWQTFFLNSSCNKIGAQPKGELKDDLLCQCKFYQLYRLLLNGVITVPLILGPDELVSLVIMGLRFKKPLSKPMLAKCMLEAREVLDDINTRFLELTDLWCYL